MIRLQMDTGNENVGMGTEIMEFKEAELENKR